jgi:hypothetical protein
LTINNETYQGDFKGEDIGRALCASFKDKPFECLNTNMTAFLGKDDDYKNDIQSELTDTTNRDLLIAGLFLIFVNLGMVWIHKKT